MAISKHLQECIGPCLNHSSTLL